VAGKFDWTTAFHSEITTPVKVTQASFIIHLWRCAVCKTTVAAFLGQFDANLTRLAQYIQLFSQAPKLILGKEWFNVGV